MSIKGVTIQQINCLKKTPSTKSKHNYFKKEGNMVSHESYLFLCCLWTTAKSIQICQSIFVKQRKAYIEKLDVQVAEFMTSANDAVSFINNCSKLSVMPLNPSEIIQYTESTIMDFNKGFDTDILLDKTYRDW